MTTSFLTSGSSRKLILGKRMVILKHGAPRNFAFKSDFMRDLVQALRSIGENNITSDVEKRISQLLAENQEIKPIDNDLLLAPVWMRNIIKRNMHDSAFSNVNDKK